MPQRTRASLSPISHIALPTSTKNLNSNQKDFLEIHGTHIVGQSPKADVFKSDSNQLTRIKNNGRKKARHKVENP